jgi:aspartate/methionine/tyrosine aminotransferase
MPLIDTQRMRSVLEPVIPVVGELIQQNPGTITLGQGVVSYGPPPSCAAEVARFARDPDNHKYKSVQGIPELIDRLTAKLRAENGLAMGPGEAVVVTAGGNMAFLNAILAITEPGDEVVLLAPYYFNHHMAVSMIGCRPVVVPTDEAFQPRLDALAAAISPRTRAVVTVSPNNPTGAVYPEPALRAINALCRQRDIFHVHDEAYEYFTYGGVVPFSPGGLPDAAGHTISLYSLSKAFGFASWRVGYMAIPSRLLVSVKKIQDTNLICPPVVSQFAACGALDAGRAYCDDQRASLQATRDVFLAALRGVSDLCTAPPADGAFYVFLKIHADVEPMTLVERLIREHRVAVMPGTAFGVHDACTVRLSYGALSPATAREGIERFVRGLRAILG